MAAEPNARELLQIARDTRAELDRMLANKTAQQRLDEKQLGPYKAKVQLLKEINEQIAEQKRQTEEVQQTLIQQEKSARALKGVYGTLGSMEHQRVIKQAQAVNMNRDDVAVISKIAELNQSLAQLAREDIVQRSILSKQIEGQYELLGSQRGIHSHIVANMKRQTIHAEQLANLTEKQKSFLEKQVAVYDAMQDSIAMVLETAELLLSTTGGKLGAALIGAGYAVDELGKSMRSFGGYADSAQLSSIGLGFIFKDAGDTLKGLSAEMGGMKDISFQTQLNTNLMATNMGISGQEAAKLTGNFARLNGNSTDTAMNLAASTKELAKANGIPIDQVMKDVSASSETFAEYGKDGGKNIAEAAVAAAKLGVNMGSLTKVTDSLLDFETSITKELELGAMLGKNINLDRARSLAYEGSIGGAVKETLKSLGGIEAFNKMDIFQKRSAAQLLGLSVEEFQKMAANSDKLNDDGTIQLSTFDSMKETLTAISTGPLAGMLKTMGSMAIGGAQIAGSFAQMGFDVRGLLGKLPLIGKFLNGGAAAAAPTAGPKSISDKVKSSTKGGKGGSLDSADKVSRMNTGNLIKGALALVILAGALYIAAKAFQEFGSVEWESVAKGLVGLMGLVGIAYVLSKVSGDMLTGAFAILVLGLALIPFAYAMQMFTAVDWGSVAAAGLALVGFSVAIGILGAAMLTGVGAVVFGAGIIALTAMGGALLVLGIGLQSTGAGFASISGSLPMIIDNVAAIAAIDYYPILGLAAALMALSVALAAVAVTGMLALPALAAMSFFGGLGAGLGGALGGNEDAKMDELIAEIKGLREDMTSGKIGVNMDGKKVTAGVSRVVSSTSTNAYHKK
jgi:hypothetical protein